MSIAGVPSKTNVLHLYRDFIRNSRQFTNYNFREYFLRKSRETFRQFKNAGDPEVQALWKQAQTDIGMLKRQSMISQMYTFDKLVVEPVGEKSK
ncbi:Isd11p Ecym_4375 [Eremothecium cymbalariae DBVPG|uniref:Complex 1 LYR protein domain-containing protein n=1 Tax=Eremothecium cymbalariae (strain CBS 270.75 / DBVPG 7215 / KCTC 17166 / NRRL Y-17582) TaxID=931890 RepID=G8JTS7_ERECY|nr:hypothetical protein Ecym_4375 [Eremothecium cymbalariae DBVPG\